MSENVRRPLSAAQSAVWMAQQLAPEAPITIGQYTEIDGPIDLALLDTVARRVMGEVEAIGVRFVDEDGVPWQVPAPPFDLEIPVIDLSAEPDPRAAAEAWMWDDLTSPIDLAAVPGRALEGLRVRAEPPHRAGRHLRFDDRAAGGGGLHGDPARRGAVR
jgi:hypothetical protein